MSVQSIQRAFSILRQLVAQEMGITELAKAVGLPKSTVARLLKTLETEGAVERTNRDSKYRIGPTVAALAGALARSVDLTARVRIHLRVLADEVGEDAGFSVPDGYRVHYLDQVDSDNPVQVRDWTGESIPMHAVPSGQVILAHWPEEALDRFLQRPLQRFTEATVTDPMILKDRLEIVRAEGFAWVYEGFADGINSVAAPILDERGRPLGAIHVHGPAYRFPAAEAANIARLVTEKARLVSAQMSAEPIH